MSWCNVLRRAGSDYCVNDNFPGMYADFRLKSFTQEKISSCIAMSVKSSTVMYVSNAVFKVPCNCCERTLNIAGIK